MTISLAGAATFSRDILGIIYSDAGLNATDALLGANSTVYPTGEMLRGSLDSVDPIDQLTISSDLRTITFNNNVTGAFPDQLRVITAVPEPFIAMPMACTLLSVLGRRRNRKAGNI